MRLFSLALLWGMMLPCARSQTLSPTLLAAGSAHAELFSFGTLDWSVGETVVSTFNPAGSSDILTQGFHQVFATVTSGTGGDLNTSLNLLIYPNPTTQWINIECDKQVRTRLFNMLGAEIKRTTAFETNPIINTNELPAGLYFLEVLGEGHAMPRIFKIEVIKL
jgi:Secretion system C-terminal sorting domain